MLFHVQHFFLVRSDHKACSFFSKNLGALDTRTEAEGKP